MDLAWNSGDMRLQIASFIRNARRGRDAGLQKAERTRTFSCRYSVSISFVFCIRRLVVHEWLHLPLKGRHCGKRVIAATCGYRFALPERLPEIVLSRAPL